MPKITIAPALLCLVCLFACLFPMSAHGAEFRLLPSITQKLEYNDNVFVAPDSLTPNQKLHDYISTTSGGLQLLTNTERLNMDFSARVDQLFYRNNPDLNATDQLYKGALRYSLSPKLSVSLRGSYSRDSRPDRELFTSGLVLNALRREFSSEGITGEYTVTENTAVALSYDHGQYWYETARSADMSYDAATLGFVHDLSRYVRNLKGRLNLGYTRYAFDGLDVNNYEATTGFEYALHEKWTFVIDGGTRYTESRFDTLTLTSFGIASEKTTNTGTAAIGTAKLAYKGEATAADLTFNTDVLPAYGSLGAVERNTLLFNLSRRLTYELYGTFNAGYYTNKSKAGEFAASAFNTETYYLIPGIRYQFNKNTFIEGSYTYTKVNNKASETKADRNLFLVRFFIQHAIIE